MNNKEFFVKISSTMKNEIGYSELQITEETYKKIQKTQENYIGDKSGYSGEIQFECFKENETKKITYLLKLKHIELCYFIEKK